MYFWFSEREPTLVGLDFFKKLVELEKEYNKKGIKVNNTIQTNGILINDEWSKFLADNNFLVGLSLDGPKNLHDINRVDASNKGTFNKVMKTVNLFNSYGVEYNILFVVNGYTARHAKKIYNFYKKNNFKYLQFIPCLDPLDKEFGQSSYSLTPEKFEKFLITLFDSWYNDIIKNDPVSIRIFDNYANMLRGYPPESCGMNGLCACQFVTESDGSVYPCDFYVLDKWYSR